MKKNIIALLLVLFGVLIIFYNHERAWVVSAICIGFGTGIFFWKDKEDGIEK
tara:strand:- start:332 stop:487 length:156 start_codon:yes stop_codon:yes gene_type:complete